MMKTELSEHTVTLRLKQVSQLRRVCLSLGKAGPVNRSEADRKDQGDQITGKPKFSHQPYFKLDKKYNTGYTYFMKTAISIPEEIFQSAESLAKRLGMSRSQLYTAAINEYLNRRQDRQITILLNSIYEEEDSFLPSDIIRLQVGSLSREEW